MSAKETLKEVLEYLNPIIEPYIVPTVDTASSNYEFMHNLTIKIDSKKLIEIQEKIGDEFSYCDIAPLAWDVSMNPYKENNYSNVKESFVKFQYHDYAYRINEEGEKIIYHDRPLKKGALLYCGKCGKYEPATVTTTLYFTSGFGDQILVRFDFVDIECNNCNTVYPDKDIYIIKYDSFTKPEAIILKTIDVFNDGDKVVLSTVTKRINCFLDQYRVNYISDKVVFNLKTGRTYLLPSYNIKTKKREGHLMSLSGYNSSYRNMHITREVADEVLNIMQEYFIKNNIEHIKYDSIKDMHVDDNVFKHARAAFNGQSILNIYDVMPLLILYNKNPFFNYKENNMIAHIENRNKKFKRIKKVRNKEKLAKAYDVYGFKKKYHKTFLLNVMLNAYYTSSIQDLMNLINTDIKDNNNRIKLFSCDFIDSNIQYILHSSFYSNLVERFNETQVINALIKNKDNYAYFYDIMHNYNTIKSKIPDYQFPVRRLRIKDLHDKIASDANKISKPNKNYIYDDEINNTYNKIINGIKFELATSNTKLTEIGSRMRICVGGYDYDVERGTTIIVSMSKDDEYIGCLEISNFNILRQAKAARNNLLKDEYLEALLLYCKECNIKIDTYDVNVHEDNNFTKSYVYKKEDSFIKVVEDSDIILSDGTVIKHLEKVDSKHAKPLVIGPDNNNFMEYVDGFNVEPF